MRMVGRRSGDSIALGDMMQVVIEDVAILRRTVYGRRIGVEDVVRHQRGLGKRGKRGTHAESGRAAHDRPRHGKAAGGQGRHGHAAGSREDRGASKGSAAEPRSPNPAKGRKVKVSKQAGAKAKSSALARSTARIKTHRSDGGKQAGGGGKQGAKRGKRR
jgi:hypothetical protein